MTRIEKLGLGNILDSNDAEKIVKKIKEKESKGYAFELADSSLDLLIYRNLPNYEPKFELIDFMVLVENTSKSEEDSILLAGAMMSVARILYFDNLSEQEATQIVEHNTRDFISLINVFIHNIK